MDNTNTVREKVQPYLERIGELFTPQEIQGCFPAPGTPPGGGEAAPTAVGSMAETQPDYRAFGQLLLNKLPQVPELAGQFNRPYLENVDAGEIGQWAWSQYNQHPDWIQRGQAVPSGR